ncbi:YlbD family protein [Halalkalibacter okhensis]|uniref:Cytosolic protein n=1 Tax=Halalkalibacter okhensis TaxID=333138 RepID=A0A0B0IHP8_9BACI|nr:YlbD family protein [Halalkalibacter okhensis]KHF40810.1 hypothetical protein LQ50_06855 [Halalkalibacter okhensis]
MESRQKLHPSVQEFKQFVKSHPHLLKQVKENQKTLQELFEEWSVLGSEHEQWANTPNVGEDQAANTAEEAETENSSKSASDTLGQIMGLVKRMNVDDLQHHLTQFSSVLSNVQNVIQSFQKPSNQPNQRQQDHPFSFRRD